MSTPAYFKRMEEKKALRQKRMNQAVAGIPQYPTTPFDSQSFYPPDQGNWYQPNRKPWHPNMNQDFTQDIPDGHYFVNFSAPQNPGVHPFSPPHVMNNNQSSKNFNQRRFRQGNRRPRPPPLPPVIIKEAPISMTTLDFKIEPNNVICFNGKHHFLSNMFQSPVVIDGHRYSSIEHYYQCTKVYFFAGPAKSAEMVPITDAAEAKSVAHRFLKNVPKTKIDQWKIREAPKILSVAIKQKFLQNGDLRKKLTATNSAIIAHSFERDNLYATGMNEAGVKEWAKENSGKVYKLPAQCTDPNNIDYIPVVGKGRNLLGALLMLTRRDLMGGPDAPLPPRVPNSVTPSLLEEQVAQNTDLLNTLAF